MVVSKRLTTRGVARLCCVSGATVKRWDDAGILASERTTGGHRRFRPEAVALFQRENELGVKLHHGEESVNQAASRRRKNTSHSDCVFFHALAAGCEEEAAGILICAFLRNKSLVALIDDMIAPAMRRIGELWLKGDLSVAEEHIATRTVFCSLHKLRSVIPVAEPIGSTAFCLGIEGDFHELPTCHAQMALENEGWEVINYGGNLPLFSLTGEIQRHSPALICISSAIMPDIERLSRDYREFRDRICRSDVKVLLGGSGFAGPQVRSRFPAEFYAGNFTNLVHYTKGITH